MNLKNLDRYLNDHLAGSCGALDLLQNLTEREEVASTRSFFEELHGKIKKDQTLLIDVLDELGLKQDHSTKAAAVVTAKVGRLKLMWEGLDAGELGLFEALEMLVLGITGKLLLWAALKEVKDAHPALGKYDFDSLAEAARHQRAGVEEMRIGSACEALAPSMA
jgi:hypothetical protein